ncbi:hypothetical protein IXZ18_08950 [Campylobacter fetus subsp. venerealis bv. intermedius]|uniref:hypothetical protein n=1 Tax=Campylobacter fetus TaxID=196 RepID=UPI0026E07AB4|nr:hypothetical protein [Campylobacter fetus]WKW28766.1 hypothetical protein IXZ18_08950 [Campylobacter fetus subsp. venerealis bv. intermedius]
MPNSILDKEIYGKTFFDENLHLKATNFDEILLNLKELEAKKMIYMSKKKLDLIETMKFIISGIQVSL